MLFRSGENNTNKGTEEAQTSYLVYLLTDLNVLLLKVSCAIEELIMLPKKRNVNYSLLTSFELFFLEKGALYSLT